MSGGLDDTICAVATPPGEGGVGIVRLSGPRAIEIAAGLVRLRCRKSLEVVRSHTLYLADVACSTASSSPSETEPTGAASRRLLDEALVVLMRKPRSFTGEDIVEFHCHGGPLILQTLCEAIVAAGGRLAEPGEFTKRAFLNGRMDLAQAEAVLDTIRAKTEGSLRIAQAQRRGLLSREVETVRHDLLTALAHVEAGLDFSEEDIAFVRRDDLIALLDRASHRLASLIETAQEGRIWREGAVVAIVGRPNVGKSSLMNALVRTDRAIVTAVPGTTRDLLDEWLHIKGVPIRLLDTAGIRDTMDPVELEGIRRSRGAVEDADLVLAMLDHSQPLTEEDRTLLTSLSGKKYLLVLNKSDLPARLTLDALQGGLMLGENAVRISASTGAGLDELRDRIRRELSGGTFEATAGLCVTHVRHRISLQQARDGVDDARQALRDALTGEFVAADLRRAGDALGEITGAISTDDILDRIFSEFCIGK